MGHKEKAKYDVTILIIEDPGYERIEPVAIYFNHENSNGQLVPGLIAIVQGPYKTIPTDCRTFGQGLAIATVIDFIQQTALENAAELPVIY